MAQVHHFSFTENNFRHQTRIRRISAQRIQGGITAAKLETVQKHFRTTSDNTLRLKSQSIIVSRRKKANCSNLVKNRKGKVPKAFSYAQLEPINRQNQCSQVEKMINKGKKLQTKHIQQWLNTLLIEYCYEQRFDKTVQLSALKKFQIDRNSLLSKLLSHSDIDRLYRSLLVYSVGFNKLLKDICKNSQVTKSIWRVYSLLIEYCAEGSFESMVAQIEREKVLQLNQLQEQVDSKDKLLDQMNQSQKVNRAKAYKQLKHLKQQHILLKNQKAIIEEDFKQADQAFNQEVTLRLKFEHKINEVNGVHRELGTKHLLLFQDFENYKVQYRKIYEQKQLLMRKIQDLSTRLFREEDLRKQSQAKQKACQQIIKSLQSDLDISVMKIKTDEKNRRNQFLSRKQLQIAHLTHQINGLKSNLSLTQQGLKGRIHEIKILIQQNSKLHNLNQNQKTKITQLQIKQNSYQNRTVDLKTQTQLLQASVDQKQQNIQKLQQQITNLNKKLQQTQLSLETANQTITLLNLNGKQIDISLLQMKSANGKLETELAFLKNKVMSLDQLASDRESLYGKAKTELKQLTQKYNYLEFQHKQLDTEFKLLKKSNQKAISALKINIQDLQETNSNLEDKNAKLEQSLDRTQRENYELRMNDQKIKSNLRDEKFQRKQVDLQFKQSLLLVTDEKNIVKQLTIEATNAKEERDRIIAEIKSLKFIYNQKQQGFNNKISAITKKLQQANKTISQRCHHIHPMVNQDIRSQLIHSIQRFHTINYLHQQLIKSLGPRQQQMNKKLKRLKRQYQYTYNEFKSQMDKKLYLKQKALDQKSKQYDKISINFDETKSNLNSKTQYLAIVQQKLSLQMLKNKTLDVEKERLKQRTQQLNINIQQLNDTCKELEKTIKLNQQKMKNTLEQQRKVFSQQIIEMEKQYQNLNNKRKNEYIYGVTALDRIEGQSEEAYQQRIFRIQTIQEGSNELNPQSYNRTKTAGDVNISDQRRTGSSFKQTFKGKANNTGVAFNQLNQVSSFNNSVYTSNDREQQQISRSNEKQITRKIKNAVSYYSKSSK